MSVIELSLVTPLSRADLPAMRAHLLRLDDIDRVQRFGQPAADEVIDRYLCSIGFERDVHYGIYAGAADQSALVGLCHLAVSPSGNAAEIGVSVDDTYRRLGVASRLLERAILHASNLGVADLCMYFLPYNKGLIELARSHGMSIGLGQGEGIARLRTPEASVATVTAEMLESFSQLTQRSVQHIAEGAVETAAEFRRAVVGES
jgi:GNAT superfamily N-acetyltransferase